jgi:two-component system, NarL family, response regulator NreC
MPEMIRLLIADDYPMFREGLKLILQQYEHLHITGEAMNGKELVSLVEEQQPDVVIADIHMPEMDGVAATKIITERFPAVKVLAFSMYGDYHLIVDMLDAGAKGYLLKDVMKDDLLDAVHTVADGEMYYCRTTNLLLAKLLSKSDKLPFHPVSPDQFNEKEREVIRLLCEGYGSKEISVKTSLTVYTVDTYRRRIYEKIGCRNLAGVVVYAVRTGMYRVGSRET